LPPPADGFYLYDPSRRHNPAALQALIGFLRDNFRKSGIRDQASGIRTVTPNT
jgi:DNA-binding transcriptional LysR family regulator